jgi:ankyrin repeat protein
MEVVELLLENGAQPDLEDAGGQTPLSRALYEKKADVVHLLNRYLGRMEPPLQVAGTPEYRINLNYVPF